MTDLTALRSFVAVIDYGSIATAARANGYSAAAVSRHIASIENQYGLQLFRRTGKSLMPSTTARVLAEKARLLLDEADEFESEVRALARGQEGIVRLAYYRAVATTILPGALAILAKTRPALRVALIECALGEEVVELLAGGGADVGFIWGYPEPEAEGLALTPLFSEALVLLTSVDREDLHEDPTDLERLVREPFAMAPGHLGSPPLVDAMFVSAGLPTPTVTQRPYDHALLRSLIAAGLVISMTPALGVSDDFRGVRRSVVKNDFRRTYIARRLFDRSSALTPVIEATIESATQFQGFGLTYLGGA